MISWSSRKQGLVSHSTVEVEYIAASTACREVVWLRNILGGLFGVKIEPTMIRCDDQSCINLSENLVFHHKSKHIQMKHCFIRDMVLKGIVKCKYIATDEQIADALKKTLSAMKFKYL